MTVVLLSFVLTAQQPPPLTEQQAAQLRDLVKNTQQRHEQLKKDLEQKQTLLAQKYAEFNLDVSAVEKLHGEILGLQKEQLTNYHKMQVELRRIVGPERFAMLRQRLDNVLGVTPKK